MYHKIYFKEVDKETYLAYMRGAHSNLLKQKRKIIVFVRSILILQIINKANFVLMFVAE